MDSWKRFSKTSLSNKEDFYSNLNIQDITYANYKYSKKSREKVWKKNLGEYHNLYVQSDTLLLTDVFETFQNKCTEIYELDPTCLLSVPWLAWQAYFKKAEVELELLTHIDMLLMVEKGIRGGISHAIHRYAAGNNKKMKNDNKDNESSYIMYLDANSLYGYCLKNYQFAVFNAKI